MSPKRSLIVEHDCNRVKKSNVQYSKRIQAPRGPHNGQGWVVGSSDLCQLLFPPVSEFSSELIEVSELEQLERNTEKELWAIDKVAPPESLWFLNQSKQPFPSVFAHPAGRLAPSS